jgi:uncharacterized protein (TIGR00303 family)
MGQSFIGLLVKSVIYIYSQLQQGKQWLNDYRGASPRFACILGFTATGSIPGISAAGATPKDREYTAIADAEFLALGVSPQVTHPLPVLTAGVSPAFITRAVIESCQVPFVLFNAGLIHQPTVDSIDLGGQPANCLSSGKALSLATVQHLFQQGLAWGEKLIRDCDYLIIGECVVGGTTTALALLLGLGVPASGKINSSHPICNHAQKQELVELGLQRAGLLALPGSIDPLTVVAAVGDPMQIVAAGMAISASRKGGILLAGGTQMLAVYALIRAIASYSSLTVNFGNIVVGTTRWVAEDPTGRTIELARSIEGVPLLATGLNFATSRYSSWRAYERGYVKEGVGAGGCAIASHLIQSWTPIQLLTIIEALFSRYQSLRFNSIS